MAIVDACGISKGYFRTMDDFKNCITCGIPNEVIEQEKIKVYMQAIDDVLKVIDVCCCKDSEMLVEMVEKLKTIGIFEACELPRDYVMKEFEGHLICLLPSELFEREKIKAYRYAIDDCLKIINECSWEDTEMLSELIAELKEFKYSTD